MGQNTHIEEADNVLRIGAQVTLQIAKTVQNDDRSVRGHQDARRRGARAARRPAAARASSPARRLRAVIDARTRGRARGPREGNSPRYSYRS